MDISEQWAKTQNYFHSSLVRSPNVLKVLCLSNSDQQGCSILMIFRNYLQHLLIGSPDPDITVTTEAIYPIEVPISYCAMIGEHIAVITADGSLMILESKPPFRRITTYEIVMSLSPKSIPVAIFATSAGGEYLVACGFSQNLVIISFDSNDLPEIKHVTLPQFTIQSVVPTQDPNIFAFLVVGEKQNKTLLKIDVSELAEVSRINVSKDARQLAILYDLDSEGQIDNSRPFLFTDKHLLSISTKSPGQSQIVQDLPAPLNTYVITPANEILYQLVNGEVFAYHNNVRLLGKLPLVSHFICLPNNLLLCTVEAGTPFILPVVTSQLLSVTNVNFDLLTQTKLPYHPNRLMRSIFDKNNLISLYGDHTIIKYRNTLPYQLVKIDTPDFTSAGSKTRLFSLPDDGYVITNVDTSVKLIGDYQISSSPTILIENCGSDCFQVHSRGIKGLISQQEWISTSEILSASICNDECIVSLSNGNVILLDDKLTQIAIGEIHDVQCLAHCGTAIAIITSRDPNVTLYMKSDSRGSGVARLIPHNFAIPLADSIESMSFDYSQQILYLSTKEGTVKTVEINFEDWNPTTTSIYNGKAPVTVHSFSPGSVIIHESTVSFIYSNHNLYKLQMPPHIAFSINSSNSRISFLDQNKNLYSLILQNIVPTDLEETVFQVPFTPRLVKVAGDYTFSMCREGSRISTLRIFKSGSQQADLNFPNSSALSMLYIDYPAPRLIIGFVADQEEPPFFLYMLDPSNFENESARLKIPLSAPPFSLEWDSNEHRIYIGEGQNLKVLIWKENTWEFNPEFVKRFPTQVAFIQCVSFPQKKGLWVADRTQGVVFIDTKNPKNRLLVDTEPRQVTAMDVINQEMVVVGDRFGTITVLSSGEESGEAVLSPPERGVNLPSGKLLDPVATFHAGETITGLSVQSNGTIIYTTLMGQIGSLVPISKSHYKFLADAEHVIARRCQKEFGFFHQRQFGTKRFSVVDGDLLQLIYQLNHNTNVSPEENLNKDRSQISGLITRLSAKAKF